MSPENAELEPPFQKYKGRVVLRVDIVKDDPGAHAVFTEQGSSASQMTVAKVMNDIARIPDCDGGQAADAASAHPQVKLEDAPRLHRIPKSECPDVWIRFPRHKGPKSWANIEDPVVPLERNLHGPHLQGHCGKVRGSFAGAWLEKSARLRMSLCSSKTRIILIGSRGRHRKWLEEAVYGSQVEEINETC